MGEDTPHPYRELIPGYALGALDPEEAQVLETHLPTCPACQADLAQYQKIADGLQFALPPQAPPARVRARLARQLSNTPARKPAPARPFLSLALGLAVLALAAINIYLVFQINSLREQQSALKRELQNSQAVIALVSQPDLTTVPIRAGQITGSMALTPEGSQGVVFLHNLPPLDPNHTYQAWLIPAQGAPVSAGLFQSPSQQETVTVVIGSGQPFKNFGAMGISIEPTGGSLAPTTQPIVAVSY